MAATTVRERPASGEGVSADIETKFHVWISPTDAEGKTYVEIDAKRVFSTPRELHSWLTSCVWKLTSDLSEPSSEE